MANLCNNTDAVGFLRKYKDEATTIAAKWDVPVSYVLGLSARECGYGTSRFVTTGNAFFNLETKVARAGQMPTKTVPFSTGTIQAGRSAVTFVYTYKNFTESAMSFFTLFGKHTSGAKTPTDFLKKLQQGGFNHEDKKFTDPAVLEQVATRLECP